jgi:phosphate transport system substrate-binding protein
MRVHKRLLVLATASLLVLAGCGAGGDSKSGDTKSANGKAGVGSSDQISIVGSSTVFPFVSAAAEKFGATGRFKAPRVESTGTGGGFAIFCRGLGAGNADIANASRQIKKSEFDTCVQNGVTDIVEIKLGYDGIVIAGVKGGPQIALTKYEVYQALAKELYSDATKTYVPNPNTTWNQINPALPATKIDVMGPPPTSGTRDAFIELVMEKGAVDNPALKALKDSDGDEFKRRAGTLREDGAWKDSGENDNLIVQALGRSPEQLGVFGFSSFEENQDRLQAATLNGMAPTTEDILSGAYGASRSLYVYLKKANVGVTTGLQEFATELMSPQAAGSDGYLRGRGMVPLKEEERAANAAIVQALTVMTPPTK